MEKVLQRNRMIHAHVGTGRISIDSPDFSGAGNIEFRTSKPDSALMKISGPFGISIGSGLLTSSEFTFYDGYNNTVLTGATTPENLRRTFRMSIEFKDVLDILSGSFGFSSLGADKTIRSSFEDGSYRITLQNPAGSEEYRINTSYAAVSRYIARDTDGNIVEDIAFKDFRKVAGIYMPFIITVLRPQHDESLSIVYERQRLNELPVDFAFSVPSGARRIQL